MKFKPLKLLALSLLCVLGLSGCANMTTGIGISLPIGGFGSIGVGVNSNGTVGGSVGVGVGPATVSVGTSGQLPSASPSASSNTPATPAAKTDDKPVDKAPGL